MSDAFGATDFNVLILSGWVDYLAVCCFFHCLGETNTSFPISNSEIFSSNSFFSSLFTFNSLISTVLILMKIIKWELILFFLEYYLVLMFVQNPSKIVIWTKTRAFSCFSVLIFPLRKVRRLCYTGARGGARKRVWFLLRSLASQLRTCRVSSQLQRYDAPPWLVGDRESRGHKGQGPTIEGWSSQSEPLKVLTFQFSSTKISWQGSAHWRLAWATGCSCDAAGGREEP